MTIALDSLIDRIQDSQLISQGEIDTIVANLREDTKTTVDGDQLADYLVEQRRLTRYQADALIGGSPESLRIGEYVVIDRIAEGGMGILLKARHRTMRRVVAIKVLPPRLLDSPDSIQRFYREVEAAAALVHTNIVTAFDAGSCNEMHYLVMQFIDGPDLESIVNRSGPMNVDEAVDNIIQAAHGLGYAHKKGIIHRDVKPSNLLRDSEGTVKILDLGLARLRDESEDDGQTLDQKLTQAGQIMGTVDFMSPEQAGDASGADARSDVYSLGCTLFWLLTGKVVFDGKSVVDKIIAHHDSEPPRLSDMHDGIPSHVEQACARMLEKNADHRYQSMDEVIEALAPAVGTQSAIQRLFAKSQEISSRSSSDLKTDMPASSPDQKPDSRKMLMAIGGILIVLGAIGAIVFSNRQPELTETSTNAENEPTSLYFDGKRSHVVAQPITLHREAFTIEARVIDFRSSEQYHNSIMIAKGGPSIWLNDRGEVYFCMSDITTNKAFTKAKFDPNQRQLHFAGVYDGKQMKLYVNGELASSRELEDPEDTEQLSYIIGGRVSKEGLSSVIDARLNEVRISSVARYQDDFEMPGRFKSDKHTKLLYHFDEGSGTVCKNDADAGDGQIIDCQWQ